MKRYIIDDPAYEDIVQVFENEYSGMIEVQVADDSIVFQYEGWGLAPKSVKQWADDNGYIKTARF